MISTTSTAIVFPLFLAMDLVDNYFRNPTKRILAITLLLFLSCFMYIWEFQTNDWGKGNYYMASFIRFSQITFYLISMGTAVVVVVEGFYHEGYLKEAFEVIISFILLCGPVVAFGTHLIEFDGLTASHNTWFLLVSLSGMMAYDLQRLHSFNINVLGAQQTMKERLIAAPLELEYSSTRKKHPSLQSQESLDLGNTLPSPSRTTPRSSIGNKRSNASDTSSDYQRLEDVDEDAIIKALEAVPERNPLIGSSKKHCSMESVDLVSERDMER